MDRWTRAADGEAVMRVARQNAPRGFTLIELLVVIAIIAIRQAIIARNRVQLRTKT